jgi:hypothetical protein
MTGLYGAPYGVNIQGPATPGGGNTAEESLQATRESLNRANARAKDYYDQLQAAKGELQTALAELETLKSQLVALSTEDASSSESTSSKIPTWAIVGGSVAITAFAAYYLTRLRGSE